MIALRWNIAQTFERLWWHNYLSGKDKAHYLSWKKSYWERVLHQVYDIIGHEKSADLRNKRLQTLDAGCGPSGIFLNLWQHQVDALDPLMDHYLQEHQLFKLTDYPNVRFMEGTLENFSRRETYDFIFCMNCINHVNDIGVCLQNMHEALKNEGFLVMTVDAHKYGIAKRMLNSIPADALHPYQLNADDYIGLLETKFLGSKAKISFVKRGQLFDHRLLAIQKSSLSS